MITIYSDLTYQKEREYIYDVIFRHFWGLDYKVIYEHRRDIRLNINNRNIFIDDSFFHHDDSLFLKKESLPKLPLDVWIVKDKVLEEVITDNSLPIIYGNRLSNGEFIQADNEDIILGIDVFGASFFMLTRYEEVVISERDTDDFDHFTSPMSIAGKSNFVERPIINEYLEILWTVIKDMDSNFQRKNRIFKCMPTHDVDRASTIINFFGGYHLRRFLGDLIVRNNLQLCLRRMRVFKDVLSDGFQAEWKYTYDRIMDISEKYNLKSTFFFMSLIAPNKYDGDYGINDAHISNLMGHIVDRGHFVGIHPEYNSYSNSNIIENSVKNFTHIIGVNGHSNYQFGGRQHYLRWHPDTWKYYEKAGISYDTTLSFADNIGFRCGICYEYPVYDFYHRSQLSLLEYPLIVMDCSGLSYMGLTSEKMIARSIRIKQFCKKYHGNFVILWHTDMFINEQLNKIYENILEA